MTVIIKTDAGHNEKGLQDVTVSDSNHRWSDIIDDGKNAKSDFKAGGKGRL